MKIENPILRGFHPDPSIVRVGEDYYIATSTFEWWPGIRLHHSKDLKNWKLMEYPLNQVEKLDLRGVGASQGIWAPCLTYDQGTFYLVYTVVNSFYCNMYDTNNYLITTTDIHGPWSEPIPLNNFGFDPSLFHDEDGKKYMVSMVTDHRIPKKYAGRLVLQEFDAIEKKMVGPVKDIYKADKIFLEGPHILKRNGWYYLFSADTGTGEGHGQSIQRSRNIWGAYEMHQAEYMKRESESEAYSILTSRHNKKALLQKSGHCDLVESPDGQWYMVHLCGRATEEYNSMERKRFPGCRRYMIGRETAIQKVKWTEDDWLVMEQGHVEPENSIEIKGLDSTVENVQEYDDFTETSLDLDYQSLRIPMTHHYISLNERPSWLRIYGRSGLSSKFSQSLIAKRMTEYSMEVSTRMEFYPEVFKQMAGLIMLYDTDNYLYLHKTHDEELGDCIALLKAENKQYVYLSEYIPVKKETILQFKLMVQGSAVQFYYAQEDGNEVKWMPIGPNINASFLSDEACEEGWFTGTMFGLCCQDLSGFGNYADFDWFHVQTKK